MSTTNSARSIDVAIAASPLLGGLCLRIPEVLQHEVLTRLEPKERLAFAQVGSQPFRVVSQSGLLVASGPETKRTPDVKRAMVLRMAMSRGQLYDLDEVHSRLSSKLSSHVGFDMELGRPYCVRCRRIHDNHGRGRIRSLRELHDHSLRVIEGSFNKNEKRWHRVLASRLGAVLEFFE